MSNTTKTRKYSTKEAFRAIEKWQKERVGSRYFKDWFEGSRVVDEQGKPLVVYRGEHSETCKQINSNLGSISFGSKKAANVYSLKPYNLSYNNVLARSIPCYLKIKNPFVNDPTEPFIDIYTISEALGAEAGKKYAFKFASLIANTDNFFVVTEKYNIDTFSTTVEKTIENLITKNPEAINELYFDIYPFLDCKEVVNELKKAGFDGAIHAGMGMTAFDIEYKVFSINQIKSATGNLGTFDSNTPDITDRDLYPEVVSSLVAENVNSPRLEF